jgi:RND superfamily putative drug exporter
VPEPDLDAPDAGRFWAAYARAVVRLRYLVIALWVVAAYAAYTWLPPLGAGGSDLEAFGGTENPAVATELRSFELFGLPLISRVAIVQRDPDGMSLYTQAEAVLGAIAVTQGSYDTPVLGALPLPNTRGAFPGSRERDTTVLTYLFSDPRAGFATQQRDAERLAAQLIDDPTDAYVGVTGSIPARAEQAELVEEALPLVETATVAAILLIVGLTFRSVVAPVLTLMTAGIAVVVTLGVVGSLGRLLGVSVPADLEPLIVALLLGVVADYSIFFLSGLRHQLVVGGGRRRAALTSIGQFSPIVAVAGITVAAGTASLVVAESALFRGFGPGMALTILVGLVVAVTLTPALMAVLGRWAFWPSRPGPERGDDGEPVAPALSHSVLTRFLTRRTGAAVATGLCVVGLTLAAIPLLKVNLGLMFVQSLPAENRVASAAAQAQQGFAAGILSPTEILLEGDDVAAQRPALERLETVLENAPGVAAVLGPGDSPVEGEFGVLVARSGDAARYLVIFDSAPLGARAVDDLSALRDRLPGLLEATGVTDVRFGIAGDTALAEQIVEGTSDDLVRISVAALLVNLLLLVLFLRALVAPLCLLACNVLALAATLGLTVLVFQGLLGHDGLTFYVPFAAAVLLVALGSDYNIFAVGHIWHLASRRPLRTAIRIATPQTTRAITSAGVTLAASFGLLALVPLRPFRELAFAMGVGILLDVLVVRALLVPALLTLVGPVSGWPWARLRGRAEQAPAPAPATAASAAAADAAARPAAGRTPRRA